MRGLSAQDWAQLCADARALPTEERRALGHAAGRVLHSPSAGDLRVPYLAQGHLDVNRGVQALCGCRGLDVTLDTAAGARCALSTAQLRDLRLLGV